MGDRPTTACVFRSAGGGAAASRGKSKSATPIVFHVQRPTWTAPRQPGHTRCGDRLHVKHMISADRHLRPADRLSIPRTASSTAQGPSVSPRFTGNQATTRLPVIASGPHRVGVPGSAMVCCGHKAIDALHARGHRFSPLAFHVEPEGHCSWRPIRRDPPNRRRTAHHFPQMGPQLWNACRTYSRRFHRTICRGEPRLYQL